jgi:hypothetical protein
MNKAFLKLQRAASFVLVEAVAKYSLSLACLVKVIRVFFFSPLIDFNPKFFNLYAITCKLMEPPSFILHA